MLGYMEAAHNRNILTQAKELKPEVLISSCGFSPKALEELIKQCPQYRDKKELCRDLLDSIAENGDYIKAGKIIKAKYGLDGGRLSQLEESMISSADDISLGNNRTGIDGAVNILLNYACITNSNLQRAAQFLKVEGSPANLRFNVASRVNYHYLGDKNDTTLKDLSAYLQDSQRRRIEDGRENLDVLGDMTKELEYLGKISGINPHMAIGEFCDKVIETLPKLLVENMPGEDNVRKALKFAERNCKAMSEDNVTKILNDAGEDLGLNNSTGVMADMILEMIPPNILSKLSGSSNIEKALNYINKKY